MIEAPDPDQGPVLVTVKYVIDPAKAPEFLRKIHKYERIRRRDGAISWGVFVDTQAPDTYLESLRLIPGPNTSGNITGLRKPTAR